MRKTRRGVVPPLWDGLAGRRAAFAIEEFVYARRDRAPFEAPARVASRRAAGCRPRARLSVGWLAGASRLGGRVGVAERLVPLDRLAQALVERDLRLEAEQPPRLGRVGRPVPDVLVLARAATRTGRKCARSGSGGSPSSTWTRRASSRIVIVSVPPRLITSPRDSGRSSARTMPVDGVPHVREGPRLPAVAVDLHRLAVEQRLDERDHRAAPPAEVVARARRR